MGKYETGNNYHMKKGNESDSPSLRQKAENLLKHIKSTSVANSLSADSSRLIHELEVHQIELELQNEELLNAIANQKLLKKNILNSTI